MTAFQWTQLFETGIEEVDSQHRRLVELVNDLADKIESGEPERISATLTALAEYTVYHFECEENLMDACALDREYTERHRQTHRQFVKQVGEWMGQGQTGGQVSLPQLIDYLINWLMFHILGDDQSMGRQVQAVRGGRDCHLAFIEDKPSEDPRTVVLLEGLHRLYSDLLERNEELMGTQRELNRVNESLEDRVRERTSELAKANEQIQAEQVKVVEAEKMASLGRMVAGFAHEVNTPVGVAVGAVSQADEVLKQLTGLLQQDEVSEDDINQQIHYLHEANDLALSNLRRAATLVTSFKRTAVDQSSERERDYSLNELLDDVRHVLKPVFKRTGIEISVNCPDEIHLTGIPGVLTQVLTNLCMNAHKHAFLDGTRAGQLSIQAAMKSDTVQITVKDDGVGMDEATLRQAFEPFFTTRRNSGGSGLGLYIVYNLVTHELGGKIECTSTPGGGSYFNIEFPGHPSGTARQAT